MQRLKMINWMGLILIGSVSGNLPAHAKDYDAQVSTHIEIAHAILEDSLSLALELQQDVRTLIQSPTEANLLQARQSWLDTRQVYQMSEALRFGNPIADDFDARLNAWPLDESLIDYVLDDELDLFFDAPEPINIIASPHISFAGEEIDATLITRELLTDKLHQIGGNEANVAIGFHAVEFLLWGQDLNGTGPGAGNRSHLDYDVGNCASENCDRRAQYLDVVVEILVDDLNEAVLAWSEGGQAASYLRNMPSDEAIGRIFKGFGSLAYGELAGERMKLGLILNDPEEEHDCFSDNTHNSHYFNVQGIKSLFYGTYIRIDGTIVSGRSIFDLILENDVELARAVDGRFRDVELAFLAIKNRGDFVERYDQLLSPGNTEGALLIENGIEKLINLSSIFEQSVMMLEIENAVFIGSDVLK